jgi:uncharacterized spore protein YtfJ
LGWPYTRKYGDSGGPDSEDESKEEESMEAKDALGSLTEGFQKFISTKTLVGDPIIVGDVTLIPLISACGGVGGGSGNASASHSGGGAAGGFRVHPVAVVVVRGNSVEVMPVGKPSSPVGKLLDTLPEVFEKIGGRLGKHKETVEADE